MVSDASSSEVAWLPADLLGDVAVGEALAAHTSVRGHNVKEMMRSLLQLDIEVRGLTLDTAIAAYLIDPAEARYALPDLIEKYTKFARPLRRHSWSCRQDRVAPTWLHRTDGRTSCTSR